MSRSNITNEDLLEFRKRLLDDFKEIVSSLRFSKKEWLRSAEVLQLLKCSRGTLQNYRNSGKLPYTRFGGIVYYNREDIEKLLKNNFVQKNKKENR